MDGEYASRVQYAQTMALDWRSTDWLPVNDDGSDEPTLLLGCFPAKTGPRRTEHGGNYVRYVAHAHAVTMAADFATGGLCGRLHFGQISLN